MDWLITSRVQGSKEMGISFKGQTLEAASPDRHLSQPVGQQVGSKTRMVPRTGWPRNENQETQEHGFRNQDKNRNGADRVQNEQTHDKNEDM